MPTPTPPHPQCDWTDLGVIDMTVIEVPKVIFANSHLHSIVYCVYLNRDY